MNDDPKNQTKSEASLFSAPAGEGEYVAREGDCLASLAYVRGLDWRVVWNDPANAALKRARKSPNILLPGDRVHLPKCNPKEESCATDQRHTFVRSGVPELLRLLLRDELGKPRASIRYRLIIEGQTLQGKTNDAGELSHPIPPTAKRGVLYVELPDGEERYDLALGGIDPIDSPTGVQARLRNLGFDCGKIDGLFGPRTREALQRFQRKHSLLATGELDADTLVALENAHGF